MGATLTRRSTRTPSTRRTAPGSVPGAALEPASESPPPPPFVAPTRASSAVIAAWLEQGLRVVRPLMLGLAINDLLASSYRGLMLFAGYHLAFILAGVVRRSHHGDAESHGFAVRFSLFGSLLLLGLYDAMLLPLCLLLLVPAMLLNAAFGCPASVRRSRQPESAFPPTKFSGRADVPAIRFALMQLFALGMLATSLVHYCVNGSSLTGGEIQTGDVFAVFLYVLMFIEAIGSGDFSSRSNKRSFDAADDQ